MTIDGNGAIIGAGDGGYQVVDVVEQGVIVPNRLEDMLVLPRQCP